MLSSSYLSEHTTSKQYFSCQMVASALQSYSTHSSKEDLKKPSKPPLLCLSEGLDQYTPKAVEQKQKLIHLVSESTSASRHFMERLHDGAEFKWSMIITKRGAKLLKNVVQFCEWSFISTILKSATHVISAVRLGCEKSCSRHPKLAICSKQGLFKISLKVVQIQNQAHPATSQYRRGKRNRESKVERY